MKMKSVSKTGLTTAAILSLGAIVATAQSLPNLNGKTFVFASFGGDLQKNQDLAWLQPFVAATGVKIEQTDSPDVATLKTQEEAQNVASDVIEIEASTVDANCGSMFLEVQIDRSQLNPKLDTNKCGVPVVKFSYVLAYNSKKYTKHRHPSRISSTPKASRALALSAAARTLALSKVHSKLTA